MTRATLIQAREGSQVAMNQVIKEYDPLIIHMAHQRVVSAGYFDDYLQAGRIGLLQAIQKVSDNSEYMFSTYASRFIRHQMALLSCEIRGLKLYEYMVLQKFYKKRREVEQRAMNEVDMLDILDELKLHPFQVEIIKAHVHKQMVSMDIDDLVSRKIEKEIEENDLENLEDGRKRMLSEMIARLTDRQANIVKMYYFRGMTLIAIADELGVSQGYISKEHHKIKGKLLKDWPNQLFLIAF
ncbi:MAG: sigma-70 family RNA polymerase sigma factor, partial [Bacteroidota bacterium]